MIRVRARNTYLEFQEMFLQNDLLERSFVNTVVFSFYALINQVNSFFFFSVVVVWVCEERCGGQLVYLDFPPRKPFVFIHPASLYTKTREFFVVGSLATQPSFALCFNMDQKILDTNSRIYIRVAVKQNKTSSRDDNGAGWGWDHIPHPHPC